ncbi:MAG: leucyl/phenylalanyl-tRNA--protein transferase [Thermodesulfobacteriota bacterium]
MPLFQLTDEHRFPPCDLAEPNGLLAIGGDLSPERLVVAYRNGIFPWFSEGDPILWWCTSPRLVLFPEEFRVSRRLARELRSPPFEIRFNSDFEQVIDRCAQNRTERGEDTWITIQMKNAYCALHEQGYCHSVESWQQDRLAGGLYGLYLDRVFFGESMFSDLSGGSKFALVALVNQLQNNQCGLIDCQMTTSHLVSFGAREVTGMEFQGLLKQFIQTTSPHGKWTSYEE